MKRVEIVAAQAIQQDIIDAWHSKRSLPITPSYPQPSGRDAPIPNSEIVSGLKRTSS